LASTTVKELIKAGVHFGHYASRWNPKMKPYIYGKRNLIHIIDVKETLRGLIKARAFLKNLAASGEDVLFVGTKRQAKEIIIREATRCGMHYVSERWLGGALTNHATIRRSLRHLAEIEQLEETGGIHRMSKKAVSRLMREKRKLLRNLSGVRNMERLPGALIVIDPRREDIAVKEARKLGIPTVCLLDTDADPELADIAIPGNDDALRSIDLVTRLLADAVLVGAEARAQAPAAADTAGGPAGRPAPQGRRTVSSSERARSGAGARRAPERAPSRQPASALPAAGMASADAPETKETSGASGTPADAGEATTKP